jgi:hypothetical protein
MRSARILILAAALFMPGVAAAADERGSVIRAGDLYSQPFIDAAKAGPLAANQPVTIVERRGGWLSVDAGGRRGWVRMLNVRLDSAKGTPPVQANANGNAKPQSLGPMRTGSTGLTVATGVKGLDEADIRNASVDHAQIEQLATLAASEDDARQQAAANALSESQVAYLKPGKSK